MIQLGEHGAHAVIAQAAGMVRRRDKAAAKGVHFGKRANLSGIAEIIHIFSPGQAGAGRRLHSDDLIVRLPPELLAHKRGNQAAQIGTASRTANDHIRLNSVFIHGGLCLQSDD